MEMATRERDETLRAVEAAAERAAAMLGLEVVSVIYHGSGRRSLLRVDVDRAGPVCVGVEDCQRMSVRLGEILDEMDIIEESYTLEISSPGIDRPIRTDDDFRRNLGRKVLARTAEPVEGAREFRGVLARSDSEHAVLRSGDGREWTLPRSGLVSLHQDPALEPEPHHRKRGERRSDVL
jgi:ribosome maturation factor RimP